MKLKFILLSTITGTLIFFGGCASSICIGTRISNGNPDGEIYPATKMDAHVASGLWNAGSWALLGEPFVIIDMPFSIVTDTLILPYDIYCAKQRVDNRFKPKNPPQPQYQQMNSEPETYNIQPYHEQY